MGLGAAWTMVSPSIGMVGRATRAGVLPLGGMEDWAVGAMVPPSGEAVALDSGRVPPMSVVVASVLSVPCPKAGEGATTSVVVNTMASFMAGYLAWGAVGDVEPPKLS